MLGQLTSLSLTSHLPGSNHLVLCRDLGSLFLALKLKIFFFFFPVELARCEADELLPIIH